MIGKLKKWWKTRRSELPVTEVKDTFSREEVLELIAEASRVAYNDGKRDGLAIARTQATRSLQAILKEQNTQP